MSNQRTVTVRATTGRTTAYAERIDGQIVVRVYDHIAGHYTVCHSLTEGQQRYVAARTLPR